MFRMREDIQKKTVNQRFRDTTNAATKISSASDTTTILIQSMNCKSLLSLSKGNYFKENLYYENINLYYIGSKKILYITHELKPDQ
jgi:hypothetical protein